MIGSGEGPTINSPLLQTSANFHDERRIVVFGEKGDRENSGNEWNRSNSGNRGNMANGANRRNTCNIL